MPPKKRVTIKLKRPNPLFEKWLTEWKEEAKARDSKMQYCFSAALQSLRKYPLPFERGRDCKILRGFGDKLCAMLDERLKKHEEGGETIKDRSGRIESRSETIENHSKVIESRSETIENHSNTFKSRSETIENRSKTIESKRKQKKIDNKENKKYAPQYRSGGYAILISLYTNTIGTAPKNFLTKDEIVKDAGAHCDASFSKPVTGTYYTAWSSMRTLLNRNLVRKEGSPARFSLTEDGTSVAEKLYSDRADLEEAKIAPPVDIPDISDLINKEIIDLTDDDIQDELPSENLNRRDPPETVIFERGSFEIVLLVDTAETSGAKHAHDDPIVSDLLRLGVNFEVRHLKVGDYVWVCRHRGTKLELVLPYVVERKRMDDFGHSIKDGRYHEQKFRLNQCGIRNVIYLVESYGKNVHVGLPMSTLMQAAVNTLLHDGFQVKFSDNSRSTAYYLSTMSNVITKNYSQKTIISCRKDDLEDCSFDADLISGMTFTEFIKYGSKHKKFTVKEMFIRHLLQLKGLSVDKALAIVGKYPTPKILIDNYRRNPETAEKLLSNVMFGKGNKSIGPVVSKVVHQLYATTF